MSETPESPGPSPAAQSGAGRFGESAPVTEPAVSTRSVVVVGTAVWALALVVTLLVPALHTGERSWWPWTCVTGIGLGLFAGWYVRRGRGSAVGA